LALKRGAVVTYSGGPYGKPRPAVVVQNNLALVEPASLTLCPITTFVVDETDDFRIPVAPDGANGLRQPSFIMSDKLITLPIQRVGPPIGELDQTAMKRLAVALRFWIDV
ncbi:MAG: type II toxin-antitoxin system PemK/MazF family toxin, partial [Wenzhouxiangella sp.]